MITVVTDSTIYMTREQAADLGVQVIPMRYMVSGQQYLESYSDCNGNFEGLLSVKPSATAQVPVSAFTSVFEELVRKGHRVLCIVISSRLSGAYSSASLAARHINRSADSATKQDVVVVDSQTTAGGLYLLCKQAVKLTKSAPENIPMKEIAAKVEAIRERIGIAFSLDSMDALRRSGRTGIVRQSVSTILNIKPILMCRDGAVVSIGTARGRTEQFRQLLACVPATAKELVINALNLEGDAVQLEQELKLNFSHIQVEKNNIGPVLGIHLGKGAIGLSWLEGKETQEV